MIESSESQNLVCENDILIVDVVSDKGELTYVDWSDAIKEYLKDVCLWDIVEDASAENNEVAGAGNNEVAGADDSKVARAKDRDSIMIMKNAKVLYLIMESCGSKRFSLISNIDSAKEAWRALRVAHDKEMFGQYFDSQYDPGSYSSPLSRKYT